VARLHRQLERLRRKDPPVFKPALGTDPRVLELKSRIEMLLESKKAKRASLELESLSSRCEQAPLEGLRAVTHSLDSKHRHGNTAIKGGSDPAAKILSRLCLDEALDTLDSSRLLYLDTETTGLHGGSGTLAFLVGLAWFEDGCLQVEQLMLQNPSNEAEQLQRLEDIVSRASAIVSYNGRRFDWPLLCNRFVLNRMVPPVIEHHIDLLFPARRIYKKRLGSVRLVHVETEVLGFSRIGDIDGSEIPGRYWEFIRTSDESLIDPILEHNLNDLVAMAAMINCFVEQYQGFGTDYAEDRLGAAKLAIASNDCAHGLALAECLLSEKSIAVQCEAALLVARTLQRKAAYSKAVSVLESVVREADCAQYSEVHFVLAKLYEHKIRDLKKALSHAHFSADAEGDEAHEKRKTRLNRRLLRCEGTSLSVRAS
jgi:uncharacterized protein